MAEANRLAAFEIKESVLLANFKPKSSDEYLARLQGVVLKKQRLHETLLASYGTALANDGWAASTVVHPRDLELRRKSDVWLAEVKVVYNGNGTEAARAALAQLLEYRYFFYAPPLTPGMVAVFSEAVGLTHTRLLESLGVASVWRASNCWHGSHTALTAGLVP